MLCFTFENRRGDGLLYTYNVYKHYRYLYLYIISITYIYVDEFASSILRICL